jgi:hypothetical protein
MRRCPTVSASTLGRATTAARGLGRSAKAIAARFDADAGRLDTVSLAPKRGQVAVQFVALGWKPEVV